jgi:hypothetical protein
MRRARLYTRDREFVTEVDIMPADAEVVLWGSRFFTAPRDPAQAQKAASVGAAGPCFFEARAALALSPG